MSPSVALREPVFWFYVTLTIGLLVVAGGVLAGLTWGLRKNVGHAWAAYRGWLVIVPPLLVAYFLGRAACVALVTAVAVAGFNEFARVTGLTRDRALTWVVRAGIAAVGVACLWGSLDLFLAMPALQVAAIVAVLVVRDRVEGQVRLLGLAVVGCVYFGWTFGHLAFLANAAHAYGLLGYLVLAVELNDVAAYTFGKALGRHPLCRTVSPNKTWEGACGALAVSLAVPWLVRFTLPHFTAWDCVAVGLIVGVGGQVGDLVVSVIKRDVGVKDTGGVLPGHGGILDRIDSLVYVAPLVFHYVHLRHGLGPPGF